MVKNPWIEADRTSPSAPASPRRRRSHPRPGPPAPRPAAGRCTALDLLPHLVGPLHPVLPCAAHHLRVPRHRHVDHTLQVGGSASATLSSLSSIHSRLSSASPSSLSSSSQPTFLSCPAEAWQCRCGHSGPPSGMGLAPAGPAPLAPRLQQGGDGARHNHPGAILESENEDISLH